MSDRDIRTLEREARANPGSASCGALYRAQRRAGLPATRFRFVETRSNLLAGAPETAGLVLVRVYVVVEDLETGKSYVGEGSFMPPAPVLGETSIPHRVVAHLQDGNLSVLVTTDFDFDDLRHERLGVVHMTEMVS